MNWKHAYRSFYYENLEDLPDIQLPKSNTALLVIDIQNRYLRELPEDVSDSTQIREWERWRPFRERMRGVVIPTVQRVLGYFRKNAMDVFFVRIACLTKDGRDRSLSQRRPGFIHFDSADSQIIPELQPLDNEIVLTKTTDSALTGTNLRLILLNMEIENVVVAGIFTDQCVSSTVRSLADESFNVIVLDDGCAAGTDELHHKELEIINNIYCQVMSSDELIHIMEGH